MKRYIALALILILAFWGCSKRDNPVEPTIPSGTIKKGHVNSPSLEGNSLLDPVGRSVYIYEPPGYSASQVDSYEVYIESTSTGDIHFDTTYINYVVTGTDYPTLYLLHGYGGNSSYYIDLFSIKDILDEMIYTGEIIPMVVVTPDCDNILGGSFYTNSPDDPPGSGVSFAGLYEDFITEDLINYINEKFNVDTVAARRGVSGHSMGGYGAIRLAMNHPDLFGSVSSMSAPLAFAGFEGLLPNLFLENGMNPDSIPFDPEDFYSIEPTSEKRITSMMFAMGAAFSPHDFTDPDTTYFHRLLDVSEFFGVDLPFNLNGELDTASVVWQDWLANDPITMLASGGYAQLADMAIYFDCGEFDDLGFNLQNQAFSEALDNFSLDHTYIEYSGYVGKEADHTAFIAERLREILKFHSDVFQAE